MNSLRILCLYVLTVVIYYTRTSAALYCSQCNHRFMGSQNMCYEPKNASDCIGCMKTVAKVKLRDSGYIDGWERMSVVVSRSCITPGNINVKPAGCYKQQNNGGYTERCYCYTDNCNSGASRAAFGFLSPIISYSPSNAHTSTVAVLLILVFLTVIGVRLGN